jgi:uncharacterized protein (DUF1778 family)
MLSMPKPHHLRQINATLERSKADKLERIAKSRGYNLHSFLVRALTNLADKTPEPTGPVDWPADATAEKFTEVLSVEVPVSLAKRLYTCAGQMRDYKGDPLNPVELARMLLVHECERETDVLQQIERVDPNYVDIVPFSGHIRMRSYKSFCLLAIRTTAKTRECVWHAAANAKVSMTKLVAQTLDKHLPAFPE